ncbi:poly [ADP-ribose] polymerase 1 [Parasteatoda tepidariorum]|uniref:poly [ADP-ribose] polymerase 1 n=1 Tax=Parasteatoda tepidariorum TaxID=114398 RepID=UPI00077FCB53|nr:poly [ADP-ribose] polymerase 1 [Parasteatoda tepidariorum]
MSSELPFVAEYAKSGRASCKACKGNIGKESLRIGIMVQSPHFDGKVPHWHHFACFFKKKTALKSTSDVANFDNLRWEDQEKFKKLMQSTETKVANGDLSDFSVEYAKSNRATCRGCEEKISKGIIRISKIDRDRAEAQRFGPAPAWRHVDCFVKDRQLLEFTDSAEKLPGFKNLSEEDQAMLKEKLPSSGVKRKNDDSEATSSKANKSVRKEDKILKLQNQLLFEMRDNLKNFKKKEMVDLLEYNDQYICKGESRILDHLSDCLVFGALKTCPACKNAKLRFKCDSYYCPGNLTEWTKCQYETKYPEREAFHIPDDFKETYDFLKTYKYIKRERQFPEASKTNSSQKSLPLDGLKIFLIGKLKLPKDMVTKKIEELGAAVATKLDKTVQLCITTKGEVDKDAKQVIKASCEDIHVVSLDFLEAIKKGSSIPHAIEENKLCTWGGDPILKFGIKKEKKETNSKVTEELEKVYKSAPQKMKVTVKGAAAVDPDSGLENKAHVYQKKDSIYNAVLGAVDVLKGSNSYYKLQILESNSKSKYWLFRSWGRVGTTIGGNKLDAQPTASDAISEFERIYLEKSGNHWWNRKNFEKKPGCMYPLEIDYGQDSEHLKELKPGDNSKLPKPVQELICLLFDIEAMKKAMVEFEIDLKKMPLGKLSKNQIKNAYKVLGEAQEIMLTGANTAKIIDVSNRFYTLIPHDFGMKKPTLLDDEDYIKSKIEMLDSLLEIEFAYSLLNDDGTTSTANKDPVDEHYEKLKTDIEVLDPKSEEFQTVQTYLKNTHASTHNHYGLKLKDVFKINRHGEEERYKEFKNLHNKKLLWHGSRLTNFVGILSQGLRIAPPEAPATGYMFGKGVYFADMVSKSANYCYTSQQSSTGLLLLCEVALGNMYEKLNSEYVTKLPKDKHSTKGLGQTVPDPSDKTMIGDVEVPYGKPAPSGIQRSALLYNEYIVYNVNQVNIKYLLNVDFKWKY